MFISTFYMWFNLMYSYLELMVNIVVIGLSFFNVAVTSVQITNSTKVCTAFSLSAFQNLHSVVYYTAYWALSCFLQGTVFLMQVPLRGSTSSTMTNGASSNVTIDRWSSSLSSASE